MELVPPELEEMAAEAYTFGALKYSDGNWSNPPGFKWTRLLGAMKRHINAWSKGEDTDPESGLNHLSHAAACLGMLAGHVRRNLGQDDRIEAGIATKQPPLPSEERRTVGMPEVQSEPPGCPDKRVF